ncbi:hypothetical protein M8J77_013634 [Diaphorina citri]|nr:hypothetical protein M8J77_013634 [Diaphorina citri]
MDHSTSPTLTTGPAPSPSTPDTTMSAPSGPPLVTPPAKLTITQRRNRRRRVDLFWDASARRQDPSRLHVTPEGRFIVTLQQAMALFRQ